MLSTVAVVSSVSVVWTAFVVIPDISAPDGLFVDFRINVWEAGRAVLDGRSPVAEYTADGRDGSPYPPVAALTTLLFALPPYWLAVLLWASALVGGIVAALLLCGVRDWRCIALALGSPPVIAGIAYGNASLLLVPALAGVWLWRDRPGRVGAVLGIAIAGKLFVWPLLIWLLLTRRSRGAVAAAAWATVASLVGWAAVGFHNVQHFPGMVRRNASEYLDGGDSVASLAANLGGSASVVLAVAIAAGGLALVVAWHRRADDLACFTWTLTAALLASPLVWTHYYALMLIPLAVATPRLASAWLLPYLLAPQLTSSFAGGARAFDAATGVAFSLLSARHCSRPDPVSRPAPLRAEVVIESGS